MIKKISKNIILSSFLLLTIISIISMGCLNNEEYNDTIVVFNKPLKGIVKEIIGDDYKIVVLAEQDIHNFQLTTKKAFYLNNAILYVGISRDLESFKSPSNSIYMEDIVDDKIRGEEVNIHYWLDPMYAKRLSRKIAESFGDKYIENYNSFSNRIDDLDKKIKEMFQNKSKEYVITHDSLDYFNRRYGLKSYVIFSEGSSSAKRISQIMELFKQGKVKLLVRENIFPREKIRFLLEELDKTGVKYNEVEVNPLEENYIGMIEEISTKISKNI